MPGTGPYGYSGAMDMQTIASLLQEIQYPIDKNQLMQEFEQKGLSEGKDLLAQIPGNETFNSAEEVMQKLPIENIGGTFEL